MLASGTRLGPYEILAPLGAGGMGEVYRARDTRLGREVAVKVLPQHLSSAPEVRARFEREARTVSSLNHPHICTLFDVGRAPGEAGAAEIDYLVMELVEGETLAQRLARGSLPASEVLRLGVQIADALDRAHRAGVIHRDLKPGNVMLTKSGAKLMDFGLARATGLVGRSGSGSGLETMTHSPTRSTPLTAEGTIVGTFQYMAPEQLEGHEADARSDLWSFGAMLYEMATGRRAFEGKSQASLIAAIMNAQPAPLAQLAPLAPPALDRLVTACLARDPDDRIQTAHDARLQLEWSASGSGAMAVPVVARRGGARLPWIVAAVFALAAATLAGVALRRPAGARNAMRVAVLPPAGASIDQDERNTVISPDGTKLVFAAVDTSGTNQLWVHDLASSIAQPLPGTGHAFLPFWSPDSRSIAFFADGKLKRVDVAGKEVQTVCLAPDGRGGAWSPNGIILFAPLSAGGLMSVPESGGQPAPAVAPDTTLGEGALRFPCFLPDGRRFLFVALDRGDEWSIKLGRLGEHTSRPVFRADGAAVFAAPDRVLYPRRGVLLAQRFDAARGRLTGEPHTIGPSPGVTQYAGSPPASVSRTGMLAQRNRSLRPLGLAWLGRDGRWAGEVAIAPDLFSDLRLSGDDTRAALIHTSPDGDTDLWSVDLARGLATRLTSDLVACERPLWSPDGRWIVCSAFVRATRCLFRRLASGGGNAEILWRSPGAFTDPVAWSPDGTTIFLRDLDSVTGENVWTLRADGKSPWQPLLNSRFHELDPRLSPDGRWLAYRSDESGRAELYVQSYPSPDVKQRVSTDGCGAQTRARVTGPFWRRDGRELLFVSGDGLTVMAASVESGTTLNIGTPRPLFRLPPGCREIEASSTGDRFLVLEDRSGAEGEAIHLLVNWPAAERER